MEFLRAKAREWLAASDSNTQAVLVERTKLSKSAISQFINGVGLGRRENQDAVAQALGLDLDRLRSDAEAWAAQQPSAPKPKPERTVELVDRYPSRPAAARAAREIGVPDAAVVAVLAWQLDSDDDPGAGWWLDQMRGEADRMRHVRRGGTSGDPADVSAAKAAASKPKLPKRRT